jgi:hypothetical protein
MFIFIYKFALWLQRNMDVSADIFRQKELYHGKNKNKNQVYVLLKEANLP